MNPPSSVVQQRHTKLAYEICLLLTDRGGSLAKNPEVAQLIADSQEEAVRPWKEAAEKEHEIRLDVDGRMDEMLSQHRIYLACLKEWQTFSVDMGKALNCDAVTEPILAKAKALAASEERMAKALGELKSAYYEGKVTLPGAVLVMVETALDERSSQ